MALDLDKLEKVRRRGSKIVARCPACAETGQDRKGQHLFVGHDGRFGCALFPGAAGHQHRQRTFELVGIKEIRGKVFEVKKMGVSKDMEPKVLQKDILGRLGRSISSPDGNILKNPPPGNPDIFGKESTRAVPSVPEAMRENQLKYIFTLDEERLLQGMDPVILHRVWGVKKMFDATVISVTETEMPAGTKRQPALAEKVETPHP